jgi:acyl carrier protein
MDRTALYSQIEQLLQLPAGTVTGDQPLKKIRRWDSFAVISFFVMVQETYGVALKPAHVMACLTVDDLAAAIEQQKEDFKALR